MATTPKRGRSWLATVTWPTPHDQLRCDLLLSEWEESQARLQRVEQQRDHPDPSHQAALALLRTIPGVGQRTSEAFVAYVDDPRRFVNNKRIGAYLGLVVREDSSGGRQRPGHITKDGPATVRALLTEAAWQGVWRSDAIRAYFQRIQQGDTDRNKIAIIATAHYLARVMLAMLRSGEVWREPPQAATNIA